MPGTEPNDEQLVGSVLSGDERAFRLLYRRHCPSLYAMARRLSSGGAADADELIQDTWVRAVPALTGFRWQSALRTWLTGILINCHRERVRRESRHQHVQLHEDVTDRPSVDSSIADRLALETAICSLPDGYREVFLLHDVEGYVHHEIAHMLDIQPGTSKSQLSRARRLLRQKLTERDDSRGEAV